MIGIFSRFMLSADFFQIKFFMPPTLEKLKGHIAFGLSVRACVCPSVCPFKIYLDTVLKFHIWIPIQKIIDTYFFKSGLSPFVELQ